MLVFSLAGATLSVSQDATRVVNLLYCRSPSGASVAGAKAQLRSHLVIIAQEEEEAADKDDKKTITG